MQSGIPAMARSSGNTVIYIVEYHFLGASQLLFTPIEDVHFYSDSFCCTLTMCEQDACGMDHTRMVASVDPVKPRSYNKIDYDR